jgi:hypothetical protein
MRVSRGIEYNMITVSLTFFFLTLPFIRWTRRTRRGIVSRGTLNSETPPSEVTDTGQTTYYIYYISAAIGDTVIRSFPIRLLQQLKHTHTHTHIYEYKHIRTRKHSHA